MYCLNVSSMVGKIRAIHFCTIVSNGGPGSNIVEGAELTALSAEGVDDLLFRLGLEAIL